LKLVIGEPLETAGLTTKDAEALTEKMRAVIFETYVAEQN
jgi:1-acyl-sn-glycerol-3-phosphate acyltransferase